jgi:hypothetical protein
MNKAIMYVRHNEQTENIKFIHVYHPEGETSSIQNGLTDSNSTIGGMASDLEMLQRVYPKMRLDLLGVCTELPFGGEVISQISEKHDIPKHFMFIACPSEEFPHDIGKLGGVRLITG